MTSIGLGSEISWSDLKAWSEFNGIDLNPDEANIIFSCLNIWRKEYIRGHSETEMLTDDQLELIWPI